MTKTADAFRIALKMRATRPQGPYVLDGSACPPGHKHSAPFKAITARQLQALVRHPAHGASLPLADMPTDACESDQIDFTPTRMVGVTSEPDTRIASIEAV